MSTDAHKGAVVTGAGQGLGRSEAMELARDGYGVVVNDVDEAAAAAVVAEIEAEGGAAVPFIGDCSDHATAGRLIELAVSTYGSLGAAVNNAGINRDRTLVKMTPEEWQAVTRMHLDSTFAVTQHACLAFKEQGDGGHVVNTTSTAGILGNFGQANYGAAKGGIATFTIIAALEMARYGVTLNVIAPTARTRMTAALADAAAARGGSAEDIDDGFDFWTPDNVAPFVAFLCSDDADHISGKVFGVVGDAVELYQPYTSVAVVRNGRKRWDHGALAAELPALFDETGMASGATNPMDARRFPMI
jgi:NAD(P)-dependent dehydrogenase (short-subunit alcohol dehydrogenase family)